MEEKLCLTDTQIQRHQSCRRASAAFGCAALDIHSPARLVLACCTPTKVIRCPQTGIFLIVNDIVMDPWACVYVDMSTSQIRIVANLAQEAHGSADNVMAMPDEIGMETITGSELRICQTVRSSQNHAAIMTCRTGNLLDSISQVCPASCRTQSNGIIASIVQELSPGSNNMAHVWTWLLK